MRVASTTVGAGQTDSAESSALAAEHPLWAALASLSPGDRDLLIMRAWDDLAVTDIASLLGCSANAASLRLRTARRRLAAAIEQTDAGGSRTPHERSRASEGKPISDDDTLDALDALRRVDPLAGDGERPPAKGSTRYRAILERAMDPDGIDDVTPTTTAPAPTPPGRADRPSLPADDDAPALRPADRDRSATRGRRRRIVTLSAAAVALAVAGVATVLRADNGVTPAVAITSAAETTAGVTSLRGTLTSSDPAAEHATAFEVAGDDMRMESLATYADGHVEGNTMVVIDDQSTQVALDGSVEYGTIERPSPFGASSAAVVTAAVDHGRAVDLGTEEVRGIEATHYRIEPDDAVQQSLSGLAPNILAWFGLEQVDAVTAIDIWVADDLIRRIQVVAVHPAERTNVPGEYTTTIEFYDFNAAIEIEPLVVDPSAPVVGDE